MGHGTASCRSLVLPQEDSTRVAHSCPSAGSPDRRGCASMAAEGFAFFLLVCVCACACAYVHVGCMDDTSDCSVWRDEEKEICSGTQKALEGPCFY